MASSANPDRTGALRLRPRLRGDKADPRPACYYPAVSSGDGAMAAGWKAAELEWGRGPRVFEMFLEPTCPYSVKAFGKIKEVLTAAGEDKITVKVRLQSQPWHLYSGVIVRAILAASTLDNGRDAAWRVMEAVAAHR